MKRKINLKDHFSDGTLDLSMNDMQEIPIKEIAAFQKATSLDLSNNNLTSLPKMFPEKLTHIVKLDLSQNKLSELPDNFGVLVNLKHLDLYKNNLKTLPLSFGSLKSLKWLDLKGNPLVPKMAQIAGPCIQPADCENAAKNVVKFLSIMQKTVEEEKRRLLEEQQRQEENDSETQIDKKDSKKKKKKKSKPANKGVVQNGAHSDELLGQENADDNAYEEVKQVPRKRLSKVAGVCSAFFKFFVLSVTVILLSLFIISLVDESTYQSIKSEMNRISKSVLAKVPKNMVTLWNKYYSIGTKYGNQFVENVSVMFRSGIILVHEWYVWFSTEEKIQMYVATLSHYWQITYIKVTELWSELMNSAISYAKN